VYGKFSGKRSPTDKHIPTVLIYGHYDVISAENEKNLWGSDPFNLTGKNGYLYGRGTSDNKASYTLEIVVQTCIFTFVS
jgi:di- and tripeptidase